MADNAKYHATECCVRATFARQEVDAAPSPEQRTAWLDIADRWAELAKTYDTVARVSLAVHGTAA